MFADHVLLQGRNAQALSVLNTHVTLGLKADGHSEADLHHAMSAGLCDSLALEPRPRIG